MPDPNPPQPIEEVVEDVSEGLFGTLEEPLRTKCRYLYATAKIEAIQDRGESPSPALMERHDELEDALREWGHAPSGL